MDPSSQPRQLYLALAAGCVAFAIYGSLLPFQFRHLPLSAAWEEYRTALSIVPQRVSRSDVLANALLFVPIGFALTGAMLAGGRRRSSAPGAVLVTVSVSVGVSLIAEFLQTFSVGRVSSIVDIASQSAGSVIGMGAWGVAGAPLTDWMLEAARGSTDDRVSRLLTAYAAAWIFVNLAPFDITVDLGDLAARLRTGAIAVGSFFASGVPLARRLWDVGIDTVSAVPLGMLGVARGKASERRSAGAAFASGAVLVAGVEFAQIFITSHTALLTDVVAGWVGVAIGTTVAVRFLSRGLPVAVAPSLVSRWAVTLFVAWCIVLCAYHWLPYDFTVDRAVIRQKIADLQLLPFAAYGRGSNLNAFNDLLTKVGLSIPLGVFAAFVVERGRVPVRVLACGWLLLAACIFAVIEWGQLFVPSRVPDVSDVFVGVCGTGIGLALGWWVQPGVHRHFRARQSVSDDPQRHRAPRV